MEDMTLLAMCVKPQYRLEPALSLQSGNQSKVFVA